MRKNLKNIVSIALAAAMVVTMGIGAAPAEASVSLQDMTSTGSDVTVKTADTSTGSAITTYNAYMAFQFSGYWVSRSEWNDSESGRNDIRETGDKISVNDVEYTYDYATQFLAYNTADTAVNDGNFQDAEMAANGTYTLYGEVPVTSFTNAGDALWNMFHISTDIPLTIDGVTCTDIKIYLDGSSTAYATLSEAKYNKQSSTNGGCYDFYIFDSYSGNHGTTGVLSNSKYTTFPTKSIKVEYTLSGLDFSAEKQSVAVATGPVAGDTFTSGGVKYKVLTRAMDDGTAGTVAVAGLNAAGKKKTSITIPTSVTSDSCKFKVSSMSAGAFKGATKLKSVTINNTIKSISSKAFYGCKALKKVTIGSKVTSIGKQAFANCTKLTTVKFGAKVKTIGVSAFSGCKSLKSVTLGKKVTSIGKTAFTKCTKLKKITIYQKVKVKKNAFKGCKKKITVKASKKANKTYTVKQIQNSGYKKVK